MSTIKNKLKALACTAGLYACRIFPINPQKIVFGSFFYSAYSDNPRALFEKMRELHPEYQYVWLIRNYNQNIEGARVVKADSIVALFHLATAACWIDNSRKRGWHRKRKKQYYVQTWHGSIAGKHVEGEVEDILPEHYVKAAKRDSKMADLFLSGCGWETKSIRKYFWYEGEIGEFGLPRSDIFFQDHQPYKAKVDDYFGCTYDTKYILYAPTFRADYGIEAYNLDYIQILDTVRENFGGSWRLLIRLHPNMASKQHLLQYSENILNASDYGNMSELIVGSDILITDYSSCMFDAAEAGKKVFLYCSDLEKYKKDRGIVFPFEELPFSLAEDNEELQDNVCKFKEEDYFIKVDEFLKKLEIFDNANASRNIAEYVFSQIENRWKQ